MHSVRAALLVCTSPSTLSLSLTPKPKPKPNAVAHLRVHESVDAARHLGPATEQHTLIAEGRAELVRRRDLREACGVRRELLMHGARCEVCGVGC